MTRLAARRCKAPRGTCRGVLSAIPDSRCAMSASSFRLRFCGPMTLRVRPRSRGVEHGAHHDLSNRGHRHEVDRVLAAPEDQRPPGSAGSFAHQVQIQLEKCSCPDDRPGHTAATEIVLCRGLHPEQLHRVVGRRPDAGYQHHVGVRGLRCGDEMRVAVAVDRLWGHPSRTGEAVDGGHHGPGARHRRAERAEVTDVAPNDLHQRPDQRSRPVGVAGQHANPLATGGEPGDDEGAKAAGPTGHEDHRSPRRWALTAESMVSPPCSTGSR